MDKRNDEVVQCFGILNEWRIVGLFKRCVKGSIAFTQRVFHKKSEWVCKENGEWEGIKPWIFRDVKVLVATATQGTWGEAFKPTM